MKTPAVQHQVERISVRPPPATVPPISASAPLSNAETREIARAIMPWFEEYARRFDSKKYWPEVYIRVQREFRQPTRVAPGTLREALLWKYGHLRKRGAIPPDHERLIAEIQNEWPATVAALPGSAEAAFVALNRGFGGRTRFVTVAFLLHLVFPRDVPIIDQHNFRAANALIAGVRPGWRAKKMPSQFGDITLVATFMKAVLAAWRRVAPASVPTERNLDKFLMMYGKAIKERRRRAPRRVAAHSTARTHR